MGGRLPAHIEVSGLIREVEANGGFAAVLAHGERDSGSVLILALQRGKNGVLYERMPQLDGRRPFVPTKTQDPENPNEIYEYIEKRRKADPDLWAVEIDVADPQRFIETLSD